MRHSLHLVATGLFCLLVLSSLTSPPATTRPNASFEASLGLAIQWLDPGDAISGVRLPSLLILAMLVAMPVAYWTVARIRFWRRRHGR
ncbi:hypothetical protein [Aquisalinus flavus]|uniref:hypothetical protein n=1 Tax=Aquisalinus flavus TaxID=1526572 RepID=UPI00165EC56B|nr:hypothetical protein [Aquisalinus flavus]MBD0425724.1 hypothetical protein [Aquisalinus flavus]UNE48666.1 hypothetical protein FF099_11705 [Aquisalinus flavus]